MKQWIPAKQILNQWSLLMDSPKEKQLHVWMCMYLTCLSLSKAGGFTGARSKIKFKLPLSAETSHYELHERRFQHRVTIYSTNLFRYFSAPFWTGFCTTFQILKNMSRFTHTIILSAKLNQKNLLKWMQSGGQNWNRLFMISWNRGITEIKAQIKETASPFKENRGVNIVKMSLAIRVQSPISSNLSVKQGGVSPVSHLGNDIMPIFVICGKRRTKTSML